jgi:hypothetical protein
LTRINPVRSVALLGLLALASAVIGLVLASPASAQFPSGCVEYDDDPCIGPIDNVDEDGNDGVGPGNGFGDGDGSGDADGKLPFTGYPLTGLILLLLVLLAVGLTIRSGTALRDKLARRH